MDDAESTAKRAFAALMFNSPGTPTFQIAMTLFTDTGEALRVSQEWPKDSFVRSEIARLANESSEEENRLPTRDDLARKIWGWIDGGYGMTFDERIKAAKLYAELNEMLKKPEASNTNNTVNQTFHVMEVISHGSDEDWERQAAAQQQGLIIEGERMLSNDSD